MTAITTAVPRARLNFAKRPMLVFWEVTRACQLACKHCRASATMEPLPGELSTAEGLKLIDEIAGFGRPFPILVLTGGDCLLRPDLFDLVKHAKGLGMPVALSPSITPQLTPEKIQEMVDSGISAVSISLDGAMPATHDGVRGIPGHFEETIKGITALSAAGLTVQVNTTVMRANVDELADIADLIARAGAHIWEVFFLVQVGRGVAEDAVSPDEHEEICHFLYDASQHGFIVRTVEAPFFRRVVFCRQNGESAPTTPLYRALSERLEDLMGPAAGRPRAQTASTRDGKGILFIAFDGEVNPAGFLPLPLGNVR
ncbi:MAG: AdoMet-dependent heme synthase, partial [Actinomycetota bacterium]|nr:AdoMet-dependent heme synthase [Actinomycetota bacterium]